MRNKLRRFGVANSLLLTRVRILNETITNRAETADCAGGDDGVDGVAPVRVAD